MIHPPFCITMGIALLLGACTRVPRDAGFPDVQKLAGERGIERAQWNRGSAEDQAAASAVGQLLTDDLTVDEAVQIALLNNRNLQATYEDLAVAQADLVQAGLLRNPVFDAQFRFDEHTGDLTFEGSLVQDFISLFQIPLRKRIAAAEFEGAKYRVAGQILDLAAQARVAFLRLQADQQILEMRRTVMEATEASVELKRRLRQAGNITELDWATERAQYEQAKADLADVEAMVLAGRERLNAMMGLWGKAIQWTIASRLPDPPGGELPLESIEQQAIARSLELGAQRQQIVAASRQLGLARPFALLPEGEAGVSGEYQEGDGWALGPAISAPIPLFDQGQARIAFAQAQLRRARQLYWARAVEIRAEARAGAIRLRAARNRVDDYRNVILPLKQQVLEQTQLQYNAMQVGVFQLLQARQQQVEAAARYIQSLRDYWLARAQLAQIMNGRLTRTEEPAGRPAGFAAQPAESRGH